MRVISGKFKKRTLVTVKGHRTRPTTDYTKEVMFDILQNVENMQVLDLFAGSGSLGLEALSRGAKFTHFVDFAENAISAMITNFEKFGCGDDCKIHRRKVSAFLKKCEEKFDLIFLDPPYDKNLLNNTIELIFENELLTENGVIIAEHSTREKIKLTDKIINQKMGKAITITVMKNKT
ncbi:MAG: 16S rRNA (guanine(966)-N(2))-methyltransferase RsmD [Candidatus Cloacimonetes bacterium]|jgi:16S rRNA (guanine966-N2)-methyltransferase|nr:16S rRNA (guanine(966)-N(2))-methyltransferase RsmD [Candidatus Cloacimonadota bacterium]